MNSWTQALINWYQKNKRSLPWRKTRDPYIIWVSEVMLQQTQVDTVIPYFERFIKKFPDVQALAVAQPEAVLKCWEGLGYYSRVRYLQQAAQRVMLEQGGIIPSSWKEFRGLPGVGDYTAGAVMSIAFNQDRPAVDGNVLRVMARLRGWPDTKEPSTRKKITETLGNEFPLGQGAVFNQALMELGALICVPRKPRCQDCPLGAECQAKNLRKQAEWPLRRSRLEVPVEPRIAVILIHEGRILLHRRPSPGLLAGLWELPGTAWDGNNDGGFELWLKENCGIRIRLGEKRREITHKFTHLVWHLSVFTAMYSSGTILADKKEEWRWVDREALFSLTLPTAFKDFKTEIIEALVRPILE